jgi:hypothetical protein
MLCSGFLFACNNRDNRAATAFYYWKTDFRLNAGQSNILNRAAANRLYIRLFDITWDNNRHHPHPEAIIRFRQPVASFHVTPVVYITNNTFENINAEATDSLAANCLKLVKEIASYNKMDLKVMQFDCDWTIHTREKYFRFLTIFKKLSGLGLQATIRLHQVKYHGITGVPPVDKGVLMFYNMGTLNAQNWQASSIYNAGDAAKYVAYISSYPLKLDIALPLFSWSLQIRNRRVVHVYQEIKRAQLDDTAMLSRDGQRYRAKKSFFLAGIYVKKEDIFKCEATSLKTLEEAGRQVAENLPRRDNLTIIYYELANLDFSEFNAENILKVSADF